MITAETEPIYKCEVILFKSFYSSLWALFIHSINILLMNNPFTRIYPFGVLLFFHLSIMLQSL